MGIPLSRSAFCGVLSAVCGHIGVTGMKKKKKKIIIESKFNHENNQFNGNIIIYCEINALFIFEISDNISWEIWTCFAVYRFRRQFGWWPIKQRLTPTVFGEKPFTGVCVHANAWAKQRPNVFRLSQSLAIRWTKTWKNEFDAKPNELNDKQLPKKKIILTLCWVAFRIAFAKFARHSTAAVDFVYSHASDQKSPLLENLFWQAGKFVNIRAACDRADLQKCVQQPIAPKHCSTVDMCAILILISNAQPDRQPGRHTPHTFAVYVFSLLMYERCEDELTISIVRNGKISRTKASDFTRRRL